MSASGAGLGLRRPLAMARLSRRATDVLTIAGLLALAAWLRLPDLVTRGPWDTDQGDQMLAIRSIATGHLTLLGPQTSTGGIHHGVVFYYLGALFALPTGGDDPTWVTLGIALGGIAAVGFTWWLARAAGGPVAGVIAGLLAAVSAQMIDASVRLWNPAFVAPAAALALAAAVQARRSGNPRWWVAAGVGFVLAGQSHVLAWVLAAPLGVLGFDELRRTGRRALPWLAATAGLVALSFALLVVNELLNGFSELRALLTSGGGLGGDAPALWVRAAFVPLRVISVPIVGDVLRSFVLTTGGCAIVIGAAVLAARDRLPDRLRPATTGQGEAPSTRVALLLGIGLALGCALLVFGAPWLSTVTPIYVDHYHLALDPIVFALLGLGAAVAWRRLAGKVVVAALATVVVVWNLVVVGLPPVNADGGWPAGLTAGQRVVSDLAGFPAAVIGVPDFKKTTAVDYPMTVLGRPAVAPAAASRVVVLCDQLFEKVVGTPCLGPAEAARMAEVGVTPGALLDRFEAAPGRWISVYEIAGR